MVAIVLSIGNELLDGRTVNSNASFLGFELSKLDYDVVRIEAIRDNSDEIIAALGRASEADLVVVTGGLGPTADDITVENTAKFLGVETFLHTPTIERMKKIFEARGRVLTDNNFRQAMIPIGAKVFDNPVGISPGIIAGNISLLPGVPSEMKALWNLMKPAPSTSSTDKIFCWNLFDLAESHLDKIVQELNREKFPVFFRIVFPALELLVKAPKDTDFSSWDEKLAKYTFSKTQGVSLAAHVIDQLQQKKFHLFGAESCTGGMGIEMLTEIPGASQVIHGGIISYSNDVKINELFVKKDTLENYGAVSEETSREMVLGALKKNPAKQAIAYSITGIAGPSGGSPDKPVGTVYISVANSLGKTFTRKFEFGARTRDHVRTLSIGYAFWMTLELLSQ